MPNSSPLNHGEFLQTTSQIQHEGFAVLNTASVGAITMILEAFDINGNPVNFNNQKFSIYVSNHYDPEVDMYDFYHIMILNNPYEGWQKIRTMSLGTNSQCIIGIEQKEFGVNIGSPLHFRFLMVVSPEIVGSKVRITIGAR
jgi:hypothetical protein